MGLIQLPKILLTISKELHSKDVKAIVVGGSVRDHFLGLESKDYDVEVYDKLRELRTQIASEKGIPPYIVFSDKTLKDLSNKQPQSKEEMLEVHGIGEVKFERYGEAFLELLSE